MGVKPPLGRLRTCGALITARKPGKRPAKADRHTSHRVLLGFGSTPKHGRYFGTTTNREKLSSHHVIDEAHYGKYRRSPGAQLLMDMGYEMPTPLISNIGTPTPISQYPPRCKTLPPKTFICKFFPLPMNEFTATPVAVAVLLTASDIARIDGIMVTFSTDPFGPSFPETTLVSGIHPTLSLDLHYDTDRRRCQITKMDPGTPAHRIPQWRSRLRHDFVPSINQAPVHTIADALQAISKSRQLDNTTIVVVLTKDDAPNCLSAVGLPQLYVGQHFARRSCSSPQSRHRAEIQPSASAAPPQLERMARCRMDSA
jgi:hypothetical protein